VAPLATTLSVTTVPEEFVREAGRGKKPGGVNAAMKGTNEELGLSFAGGILCGTLAPGKSGDKALAASARLFAADASSLSGKVSTSRLSSK
jgi:hypothetical protein